MKTSQRTLTVVAIAAALCLLVAASVLAAPSAPNAVTISKTVEPLVIKPDYTGLLTYTIILLNDTGTVPAFMTDTLPIFLSFNNWVGQHAGALAVGDVVTWTGNLEAGSPVTLTFTAKLPDPESMTPVIAEGKIDNTAYVAPMDGTVILPPVGSDTATTRFYRYIYLPLVMRNFAQ